MEIKIFLLCFLSVCRIPGFRTAFLRSINLADNTIPEKGHNLSIKCDVIGFQNVNNVSIYKTKNENFASFNTPLTVCTRNACVPSTIERYRFTAIASGVLIYINELVRATDQGWWHCKMGGTNQRMELTIYTTPTVLIRSLADYGKHDLSRNPITMTCYTPCMYPQADVDWYYSKPDGSEIDYSLSSSVTTEQCDAMEKRQQLTLKLNINTTLPDNFHSPVKFRCGISTFPGLVETLYSQFFDDILFAVIIQAVVLFDEERPVIPDDTIFALDGRMKTIECRPGTSRPPPDIIFYLGGIVVQHSKATTFNLATNVTDTNKTISCRAYNLQHENAAVESFQATLIVRVKPKVPEHQIFSELAAKSVKISWTPGEDGGLNQTIHVQYKKSSETEWTMESVKTSSGQTHIVIDTLSPGTLYQFRLYASNKIGRSETTPTTYFATPCQFYICIPIVAVVDKSEIPAWIWVCIALLAVETLVIIGLVVYMITHLPKECSRWGRH